MMELHVTSATDRGRVRPQNEDSVLADPPLVAVADGMGGHNAGEVASSLALEKLAEWKDQLEGLSGRSATQKLREAFGDVNRAVFDKGQEDESLVGMGTTLTAGWIDSDVLALAHVGDSRAYLLRGGSLSQLTEDQNVAQEWVRRGRISEEEAATSPQRHVILQAIGVDTDALDIETSSVSLRAGDRLVFASDGLFGMLRDNNRLRDILIEHPDRDEACRALIDAANAAGGEDNISVVVIDVVGDAATGVTEEDEAPTPVIERDEAPAAAERARTRLPRSAIVAGGALVLVVAMVLVFVVARPSSTLVVSSRDENVVVLEGKLGDADGEPPATGEVVHTFSDATVDDFAETTQRYLRGGIEVESRAEAERVVDQLPRVQGPKDTPTPEPKESPSSKDETPTPKPKKTESP